MEAGSTPQTFTPNALGCMWLMTYTTWVRRCFCRLRFGTGKTGSKRRGPRLCAPQKFLGSSDLHWIWRFVGNSSSAHRELNSLVSSNRLREPLRMRSLPACFNPLFYAQGVELNETVDDHVEFSESNVPVSHPLTYSFHLHFSLCSSLLLTRRLISVETTTESPSIQGDCGYVRKWTDDVPF